jgi:tRNA 2-thiouridine synthesizing protein A
VIVESSRETADLLRDLKGLEESACAGCGRRLCGHHALIALVMGFKDAPRCASCLAQALGHPLQEFLDQVLGLISHRDCYRSGQAWADEREPLRGPSRPCLTEPAPASGPGAAPSGGGADAEWDAGFMGCGDLVLELRNRLERIRPGGVLRVTARDPGAPEDLPAWCRLTGNALVDVTPPLYVIRRKES